MPERPPAPSPPFDLPALRRRIPLLERAVVMTGCSHAPLAAPVRDAAESYLSAWEADPMQWGRWIEEVERAKAAFARLLGVDASEVAVTTSLSAAAASIASALELHGDRRTILTTDAEFPTVAQVWGAWAAGEGRGDFAGGPAAGGGETSGRGGLRLRWVDVPDGRIDPAAYEAAIDGTVVLVSVPAAHYGTGALPEGLGRIVAAAREAGAITFVDAYQAAGTGPLDPAVLEADVVASGCVKFLMGTSGVAFMRVRPEAAGRLEPAVTGWFGRREPFSFDPRTVDWAPGARRFETGTPPVAAAVIARAGIELLLDVGIEAIGRWNGTLSRALVDGGRARGLDLASPGDPDRKTPLTAFRTAAAADPASRESAAVEAALRERGVLASARGEVIRLAPHFYNTLDEVERALDALVEVLG